MPERTLDGRYRLVHRLGAGGMGEVWRAHDEHLRREVAVKLVNRLGLGEDPSIAARFVREARAVARLSSPHIVTVYELGSGSVDGGPAVPYLVMELLDGRCLDRVVRPGLPLGDVARWGGQMCKALDTAHTAGVVHRDMKPANILVTGADPADREDSLVKVLDFGIARLLDSTGAPTALTATGTVVGTPAYMSPEQARGDVPVDERTDFYSLGCILYELVTGRLPFEAHVWHVLLLKHMKEPPVPPSRHRPELPGDWDELILDLLAKDPDDRPRTTGEVRDRLGELGAVRAAPPLRTGPRAHAPHAAHTRTTPTPPHPPTRMDSDPAAPRPRPGSDPGASAPRHPAWLSGAGSPSSAPNRGRPAVRPPATAGSLPATRQRVGGFVYVALTLLWLTAVLLVSWKISGGLLAAGVVWYLVTRGRRHFQQGYYQGEHR